MNSQKQVIVMLLPIIIYALFHYASRSRQLFVAFSYVCLVKTPCFSV